MIQLSKLFAIFVPSSPLLIRTKTEIIPLSPYDFYYIYEIQIVNHSGIAILSHYVPTMYPL